MPCWGNPAWWVGIVLIQVFAVSADLPVAGNSGLWHYILPGFVGLVPGGRDHALLRSSMLACWMNSSSWRGSKAFQGGRWFGSMP
jgi:ABC-type dipeptide/oligopeptide/nickel transport system permease component